LWSACLAETDLQRLSFVIDLHMAPAKLGQRTRTYGDYAFCLACECGNLDLVKWLEAENRVDINVGDNFARTGFWWACMYGQVSVVKHLLPRVNLTKTDIDGLSALHASCIEPNDQCGIKSMQVQLGLVERNEALTSAGGLPRLFMGKLAVFQLLLDNLEDVDAAFADIHGNTPLFYACRSGYSRVAKELIERQSLVTRRNMKGETPFHWACGDQPKDRLDSLHLVKLLIEKGSDVNAQDEHLSTPFMWACSKKRATLVRHLIPLVDISLGDKNGKTPLHEIAMGGRADLVELMCPSLGLDARNAQLETAFWKACRAGKLGVVKVLKAFGADTRLPDHRGLSPLHAACLANDAATVRFLTKEAPGSLPFFVALSLTLLCQCHPLQGRCNRRSDVFAVSVADLTF
jgi:ankyrin repeat protein